MANKTLSNQTKLKEIIRENGFTRENVAQLCSISKKAVDSWLAPESAKCFRYMPDSAIHLLKLKIQEANK